MSHLNVLGTMRATKHERDNMVHMELPVNNSVADAAHPTVAREHLRRNYIRQRKKRLCARTFPRITFEAGRPYLFRVV